MAAVQLSNVNGTLLPPTITAPIFLKAAETSAVQQLARKVPLSITANTAIPVLMDVGTAGWVSEGAAKPVASGGVGLKIMTGKKVALLVPVSQEVVMSNAAGLYDQLVQDLPTAISRAFDYAAIHGLDLKTGAAGPFADYLAMTSNTQVIGASAANAGGAYTDLWKGVSQVVNAPIAGYDFNGFAADPRLRPELATSVDNNGRPFFVDSSFNANSGVNAGNLIGYPAYFNTGVSGRYYRQGDAVQVVTIVGIPTGGTFTITIGGVATSALAYNATAGTVQTAIQMLPAGAGATVTGSAGGPYTITFTGPASPIVVNQKSLTGGTAATSAATVAQSPTLDSGVRAIGGDWSQCAWGQGMDISIQVSREASYTPDGGTTWVSAFQNNLVLLLVEAYYGFVVGDPNAFVAYTHAVGS
ncbi:MAG: phage major capsid protein [Actinomycetota bacterium]|nr:phage major capsid protein [Actinomycetota bacterium]MDP9167824.1 phage major capsid protein [Actinomycetota bacterium]